MFISRLRFRAVQTAREPFRPARDPCCNRIVEPTRYETILNLTTAKAIGLTTDMPRDARRSFGSSMASTFRSRRPALNANLRIAISTSTFRALFFEQYEYSGRRCETPAESVSKKSPRCLLERMQKGPEPCPGLIVLSKNRQLVIHANARRHGRHRRLRFRFFGDHRRCGD